jgi:hypothetical protein
LVQVPIEKLPDDSIVGMVWVVEAQALEVAVEETKADFGFVAFTRHELRLRSEEKGRAKTPPSPVYGPVNHQTGPKRRGKGTNPSE